MEPETHEDLSEWSFQKRQDSLKLVGMFDAPGQYVKSAQQGYKKCSVVWGPSP